MPDVLVHADVSTPSSRAGSSGSAASSGLIAVRTVCQSTPSLRATDATEALSRWMHEIAHHAARTVSLARGPARSWTSVNTRTRHDGSLQR